MQSDAEAVFQEVLEHPEWPEGVTFEKFIPLYKPAEELPEFNLDYFAPELKRFVQELAESVQVPVDMVAVSVLSKLSLCLMGKFRVYGNRDHGNEMPLNLYTLTIADSGERKSAIERPLIAPIAEYERQENERRKPEIASYQSNVRILTAKIRRLEAIIAGDKRPGKDEHVPTLEEVADVQQELANLKPVHELHLLLNDVTPEALVDTLAKNDEKAGIVGSEGGALFGMLCGRYSSVPNLDLFLQAYDGDPYTYIRKSSADITLRHPLLVIGESVQPRVVQEAFENQSMRERGFLARFLMCQPKTRVGSRVFTAQKLSDDAMEWYRNLIFKLLALPDDGGAIAFSDDGYELLEMLFDDVEARLNHEFSDDDMKRTANRITGSVARIAAILHVVGMSDFIGNPFETFDPCGKPIGGLTTHQAVQIGKYFLAHEEFILGETGANRDIQDARYLLGRILRLKEVHVGVWYDFDCVSVRNIKEQCKDSLKREPYDPKNPEGQTRFDAAMQLLEARGYIRRVAGKTSEKGGRPADVCYINNFEIFRNDAGKILKG